MRAGRGSFVFRFEGVRRVVFRGGIACVQLLVVFVRAGAIFHKSNLLERPVDITADTSATEPLIAGSCGCRHVFVVGVWQVECAVVRYPVFDESVVESGCHLVN
jgi:hypothetical protein